MKRGIFKGMVARMFASKAFVFMLLVFLIAFPSLAFAEDTITSLSDELALQKTKVSALRSEVMTLSDTVNILMGLVIAALVGVVLLALVIIREFIKAKAQQRVEEEPQKPLRKQMKGSMVHYPLQEAPRQQFQKVEVKPVLQNPADYSEKQEDELHEYHKQLQRKSIMRTLKRETTPKPIEALKRDTRQKAIYDLKKELKQQKK